jgi:L-fucono-1,5-lactonase
MPVIDAHHHLWNYDTEDYAWIGPEMNVLRRDFMPADLHIEMQQAGVDGAIAVQARQTLQETEWLLSLAAQNEFMRGVVGWAPLIDAAVSDDLERLAAQPKLKGIRHVLQDEPDDFYMLRNDFNAGITQLRRFDLVYDVLIFERHLPQTIQFLDRHPDQVFVIDHIAKPRIREGLLSPWRENLKELARRNNCFCKLSGVLTEADWQNWRPEGIHPYLDAALDAFGPNRCLFGSDWPVLLLADSYAGWVATVKNFVSRLSSTEQARVLGGTAAEVYRLD